MECTRLMDRYTVFVARVAKSETECRTVDDVIAALTQRIEDDPGVALLAVFDHYAHTRRRDGVIASEIRAAKNLVFCFGPGLPDPSMLALRPRSIGIADVGDQFVISFQEAPLAPANDAMRSWVTGLRVA
ncbi:DUF6858 family protein [Azospirillum halopraeferens]|uniref:DUF6858 family protein n=1 Tax=Azospirillum halopraeferens TaxID=34010 RepID=UPI00048DDD8C|nr:hypothetical protein [Azospirillum halopraeferens]